MCRTVGKGRRDELNKLFKVQKVKEEQQKQQVAAPVGGAEQQHGTGPAQPAHAAQEQRLEVAAAEGGAGAGAPAAPSLDLSAGKWLLC